MHVLEGAEAVRMVLDGACEGSRRISCRQRARCIYVPYSRAGDAAEALLICQTQGLLLEKLAAMDADTREATYALTLVMPEVPN